MMTEYRDMINSMEKGLKIPSRPKPNSWTAFLPINGLVWRIYGMLSVGPSQTELRAVFRGDGYVEDLRAALAIFSTVAADEGYDAWGLICLISEMAEAVDKIVDNKPLALNNLRTVFIANMARWQEEMFNCFKRTSLSNDKPGNLS